MRKKIGTLLIIGSLGALCAGLAACSNDSEVDKYFKNGNVISVTYDASGGSIAGGTNVKLMDMFNPDKFTADENGIVKFKLRDPTDPARPKPSVDNIKVTNGENSLVGWYRTRETVSGGEGEDPVYTYADPWNFETDYVEFDKNKQDKLEFTLYAAWIPQYTFEYYYKKTADGEWQKFGTTGFDYLTATEEEKTLYIPAWSNSSGKMEHAHSGSSFTFPSVPDMTFKAAYSEESCTTPITSLLHSGSLDRATANATNTVQKIYVEFEVGNRYRISTAKQFADIADLSGQYTILNDLDFAGQNWPIAFLTSEFKGTIKGENGAAVTFKNVEAQYNVNSGATYGGLFGRVGKDAEITNVTFENATLSYKKADNLRGGGSFGLFAGEIADGAKVESVSIGGELQLWRMRILGEDGLKFNLTANMADEDKKSPVTNTGIVIKICGEKVTFGSYKDKYEFDIDPDNGMTTVDADGNITITLLEDSNQDDKRAKRMKEKQEFIVYGGNENE